MERIDITTTRSTEGGLFFRRELEFPTKTVATPLKTIPAGSVTADDLIDDEFCDIVETHKRVDTSDLEAYRSGSRTNAIVELQRDIEVPNGENIVVVFLEFTDAQEIDPENMRTILDIQDEVADVLTMPLMPSVTDALSPLVESDVRFDRSPWPAYYNSVRHFIECVENYSKPPMGMLPPIGGGRRFEISIDYRDAGVQLFGVDFAGLKATESTCNDDFQDLIADLSRRWGNEEIVLYSLNFKRYHPLRNANQYPCEAFALLTEGVDIAGETYIHRQGGGGGAITNIKAFNTNNLEFDVVPLDSLVENWGYPSTIQPDVLEDIGDSRRGDLRKLVNAELMSIGFRKLRAAIRDGNERSFLEGKSGYTGPVSALADAMVENYENAMGRDFF